MFTPEQSWKPYLNLQPFVMVGTDLRVRHRSEKSIKNYQSSITTVTGLAFLLLNDLFFIFEIGVI